MQSAQRVTVGPARRPQRRRMQGPRAPGSEAVGRGVPRSGRGRGVTHGRERAAAPACAHCGLITHCACLGMLSSSMRLRQSLTARGQSMVRGSSSRMARRACVRAFGGACAGAPRAHRGGCRAPPTTRGRRRRGGRWFGQESRGARAAVHDRHLTEQARLDLSRRVGRIRRRALRCRACHTAPD